MRVRIWWELRQTNIDLGLAGNARIVANAADPFDTPEQIVIRERINCVNSLAHWQIITESESIKEPRGRSRSQSYSQIALLHSHLFLHDQLTFADISGTDRSRTFWPSEPRKRRFNCLTMGIYGTGWCGARYCRSWSPSSKRTSTSVRTDSGVGAMPIMG